MKYLKLYEELISEIGDAGMKIRPWRRDGANSDYESAQEFKDIGAEDTGGEIDGESWYKFTTKQGTEYSVCIEYQWYSDGKGNGSGTIVQASVDFYAGDEYDGRMDKSMSITNKGEVFVVMATVTDIVVDWINEWNKLFPIEMFIIEPKLEKDERDMLHAPGYDTSKTKRGRLYQIYIKKQIKRLNKKYFLSNLRKDKFIIYPK
tara:strand:- start:1429 stop:2040 length:612 start_codon:yes stop_codon:yes gene_type:complete